MREILMILIVTSCTITSQMLVKLGVNRLAIRDPAGNISGWLWGVITSPSIIGAVVVQAMGFLLWVVVVARMKLGVAFAISGAFFYILMAFGGWIFYGERLNLTQWLGLLLISGGVLLMSAVAQ